MVTNSLGSVGLKNHDLKERSLSMAHIGAEEIPMGHEFFFKPFVLVYEINYFLFGWGMKVYVVFKDKK